MGLSKRELNNFKDLLMSKRKALLAEAAQTLEEIDESAEIVPDSADQASLEADRAFLLRVKDRERKLIRKIDEAILSIQSQTFGVCKRCDEPIPKKRLKARPETNLCIECKEEAEERETNYFPLQLPRLLSQLRVSVLDFFHLQNLSQKHFYQFSIHP